MICATKSKVAELTVYKTRTAVKGKLINLGLGLILVVVAAGLQNSVAAAAQQLLWYQLSIPQRLLI